MRITIILLAILYLISGCRKEKNNTIKFSGNIYNYSGSPAANVNLRLYYQEIQNNTYSSAFTFGAETTSNSSGGYSIELPAPKATAYKFVFSSPYHFTKEIIENSETVARENNRDFQVDAKSWLAVRIHNINPMGIADQLTYQNTSESYGCNTCCDNSIRSFYGMNVDTTIYCMKAGGQKIKFRWTVIKASSTNVYTDSIVTIPYDTLVYDLPY